MPEQAGSKPSKIEAVRGTADLLPEEAARWRKAEGIIRDWFGRYGFGEVRTPVFEHAELFHRPLGEGSDVVAKEMYEFKDRGDRLLALRPEGTAPVVRAYIGHGLYAKGGRQKLFYIGPIFRYDRPQAGRYRQHHQAGVEVFGDPSAETDADLVFLAADLLNALGVVDFEARVNSGGCPKCRPAFQGELRSYFTAHKGKLCQDCAGHRLEHNVLRILDCKEEGCRKVVAGAPVFEDKLCDECRIHFKKFTDRLGQQADKPAVLKWSKDKHLVRGFDYYTRTVFEIVGGKDSRNALLGGGRYDGLVSLLGGPETPATGWAMGMERVLEAGKIEAKPPSVAAYVVALAPEAEKETHMVARKLRNAGIACELHAEGRKLKHQMEAAGKSGAKLAVLVGADGKIEVKDLATGKQEPGRVEAVIGRLGRS